MTVWNVVWGLLLLLATMPYIINLKTADFSRGKTLIEGCVSLAFTANLVGVVLAALGMYGGFFMPVRVELFTTAFCCALVAGGWRHQAILIYQHREDLQLAEKMAKAAENFSTQLSKVFSAVREDKSG